MTLASYLCHRLQGEQKVYYISHHQLGGNIMMEALALALPRRGAIEVRRGAVAAAGGEGSAQRWCRHMLGPSAV